MVALRPYQTQLIDDAREALRTHRSVLVQLPTGAGKTAIASWMLGRAAEKQRRSIFCVHRQEILDQAAATFDEFEIPYGIVTPGYAPNPFLPIQICSIDTLRSRIKRGKPVPAAHMMVIDEGHHAVAKSWQAVVAHYHAIPRLLLTATPERLDGKGLSDVADAMVCGPSVRWLIDHNFLSPYRAFAPSAPDMTPIHTERGDYKHDENEETMDKPAITGDAVSHYLKLARGKRGVAFCVSIKHSEHVAAQFNAAGVPARHFDGTTDRSERRRVIEDFRSGAIQVLTNVDLVSEGFNLPAMEVSMMLRPTKSLALVLQQIGRSLRTAPGKEYALILDHAGNLSRHGLPDDEREWSLLGRKERKKKEGEEPIVLKNCPVCYHCHRPANVCPACGFVYVVVGREVDHREGDLVEIDPALMRRERLREQGSADTLEALIEVGKRRNYKNPYAWAKYLLAARSKKRA